MWKLALAMSGVTLALVLIMLAYMCFMAAERNGWQALAERYGLRRRGTSRPGADRREKGQAPSRLAPSRLAHFQSAQVNGFAFHGTLVLGVSEEGLYSRPILPVRLFHPPLLVPWRDLEAETFVATHSRGLRLRARDPETGALLLELDLGEATRRRLADQLDDDWRAAHEVLGHEVLGDVA